MEWTFRAGSGTGSVVGARSARRTWVELVCVGGDAPHSRGGAKVLV
jgi:hypothetical protein